MNNASKEQHFNIKISPSAHRHLCSEKKTKQNRKIKGNRNKTKQFIIDIKQNLSLTSKAKSV